MKISDLKNRPANLEVRRLAKIRARELDIMANKFAQDLNALVHKLVRTELLAHLPQALSDPTELAPCLERMRRLAHDAVRLVRRLSKPCVRRLSGKNPTCSDTRCSIPVSRWKVVSFKRNVKRLKGD